jgi:hypothetical protein
MFKVLERVGYETPFIGFSNGDILFDQGISQTLEDLLKWDVNITRKQLLLTGRRRNVVLSRILSPVCLSCLTKLGGEASLFIVHAEDYFIISEAGFPWDKCPSHVIGDVFYDNWLVGAAIKWPNITVIDGSLTINAIHQSSTDGNFSGHAGKRINANLTPRKDHHYINRGTTLHIPMKTWSQNKTCPAHLKCIPVDTGILSGYAQHTHKNKGPIPRKRIEPKQKIAPKTHKHGHKTFKKTNRRREATSVSVRQTTTTMSPTSAGHVQTIPVTESIR